MQFFHLKLSLCIELKTMMPNDSSLKIQILNRIILKWFINKNSHLTFTFYISLHRRWDNFHYMCAAIWIDRRKILYGKREKFLWKAITLNRRNLRTQKALTLSHGTSFNVLSTFFCWHKEFCWSWMLHINFLRSRNGHIFTKVLSKFVIVIICMHRRLSIAPFQHFFPFTVI